MKRLVLSLSLCLACALAARAQGNIVESLERNVPGQGRVVIHQDPRIAALIGSASNTGSSGERKVLRTSGYRVQVYAGNNTKRAKDEAYAVAAQVKDAFPELPVYAFFNSPRWLCRVGDFRSIEEADAVMRRLRATDVFKETAIVRDQINLPL